MTPGAKAVLALRQNDCRWPIGDIAHVDFRFCGKKRIPGMPYCERHRLVAFQPPQPRNRDLPIPAESNVIRLPVKQTVAA